jgi:hypothetical protein
LYPVKKWILSIIVFLFVLALTGVAGFFVAIFLAGPHSDFLPGALQIPVGVIIWTAVFGVPIWLARKTFLKYRHG